MAPPRAATPAVRRSRLGRWTLLRELDRLTDGPLIVLSFVWLALLVVELVQGLSPALEIATYAIWAIFIADFAVELLIAPDRWRYVRTRWLTVLSLALPALRLLRVVRLVRAAQLARTVRPVSLFRIVTSISRSTRALGRTLARRGLGYVLLLTALVAAVGAAGMLALEAPLFTDYGDALWWTLMILITIGSESWPTTVEARILTLLLASYGFVVFGYITATLASHFLSRPGEEGQADRRSATDVRALRLEIEGLRRELRARSP